MGAMSPTQPPIQDGARKKGAFARFLDFVEWLGNLLPHPVTLFALICVGVLLLSGIAGALEWQVADPRPPVVSVSARLPQSGAEAARTQKDCCRRLTPRSILPTSLDQSMF